jgi:uncharacterized protein YgbK (DUF1537 family)
VKVPSGGLRRLFKLEEQSNKNIGGNVMALNYSDMISNLPPEWDGDPLPSIRADVVSSDRTVIVLDDDPTGTQTVADVPILAGWSVEDIAAEFTANTPLVFVLTNSRSMPPIDAERLASEIGENICTASERTGRAYTVISRSDSTLRGHFPGEVDALADATGMTGAARVIVPFFLEGGRYTVGDVHYVREDENMIPAAETPFAGDSVFGYGTSHLPDWVAEKTSGKISSESVLSITLDDIRIGGPEKVLDKLLSNAHAPAIIFNAASYRDMEVAVRALIDAEKRGMKYLYRTAASFVRVMAGLSAKPIMKGSELGMPGHGGGLTVVGSYVPKSGSQLEHLICNNDIGFVELNVPQLLGDDPDGEIGRVSSIVEQALADGKDMAVYTSRDLAQGHDAESSLAIGNQVSTALVRIVRAVAGNARYIIAKGGITSSDIATDALRMKRALVLGQILPGIPVWRLGKESLAPGVPYIVFPGNVGGVDALTTVVKELAAQGHNDK